MSGTPSRPNTTAGYLKFTFRSCMPSQAGQVHQLPIEAIDPSTSQAFTAQGPCHSTAIVHDLLVSNYLR